MKTKSLSTVILFLALVGVVGSGIWYVLSTKASSGGAVSTRQADSDFVPPGDSNIAETLGNATLSLGKPTGSLTVGEQVTVEAMLTSEERVNGVEVTVHYDPSVFSFQSVKPGSYFSNPIEVYNNVDATSGTIIYAVGTLTATPGSAPVALFTFVPLVSSPNTSVVLDQSSIVSISGGKEARMSLPVTETYSILN